VAEFLPGVNPLAAGLAGTVSLGPDRFLIYAAAGAFPWAGAWIVLGYACSDAMGLGATWGSRVGMQFVIALAAVLIAYLVLKYARRRRFLAHLRIEQRLDTGDPLVIVDLRTALDIEAAPHKIPGARLIDRDELKRPHQTIPRDQRGRLLLRRAQRGHQRTGSLRAAAIGFHNVHPLSGGLEAWRQAGFPVERVEPPAADLRRAQAPDQRS